MERNFPVKIVKNLHGMSPTVTRRHMLEYSQLSALQIWYADIDLAELIERGDDEELKEFQQKRLKKASEYTAHEKEFAKMTYLEGTRARIKDEPPLIFHPTRRTGKTTLKRSRNHT
jgi:hypothetical protein